MCSRVLRRKRNTKIINKVNMLYSMLYCNKELDAGLCLGMFQICLFTLHCSMLHSTIRSLRSISLAGFVNSGVAAPEL